MPDLRQVFNDLIRFEIELWNAVDARLKREFDLPLTHFEPMSVMDRLPKCRVYDIAVELGITTGGAGADAAAVRGHPGPPPGGRLPRRNGGYCLVRLLRRNAADLLGPIQFIELASN